MPVRLGRFEMPKRLQKEEATATSTYARFIADPFETGYGHTIGNSLRRVLLSSLEGAAITSLKVDGAMHEFATVEGVAEDVTDIVLNLKKIKFKAHTRDEQTLLLSVNKEGAVTAADVQRVARGDKPWDGRTRGQVYSALDVACLDLQGKAFGVPVANLLGGVVRERNLDDGGMRATLSDYARAMGVNLLRPGTEVWVEIDPRLVFVFPAEEAE